MSDLVEDRLAIIELINLHGHLFDNGELERLDELFTDDVRYDVTHLGGGVLVGIEAIRAAATQLGDANPVAHHVTNVVVTDQTTDTAHVRSKGLAVMTNGTTASATYEDHVVRTEAGWRLAHRTVRPRTKPLHP
ncbi:nuclear transport factor 2 family protein [Tenggerimyces flavus]|uniref:Nuclear transport factor 2 family protein n=1 Tax=Tenggerimyces flavus TaxID=1708749 RepID=A0ABV7YGB2_9ACTN|nr:nuclear transport factor 2 family protein [Tenggerimyces flavus]MBM7788053.1 hypothetical protein [Tenggerimyces flavus]